jgi:uncharacterized protein YcbK (DUF882 family)
MISRPVIAVALAACTFASCTPQRPERDAGVPGTVNAPPAPQGVASGAAQALLATQDEPSVARAPTAPNRAPRANDVPASSAAAGTAPPPPAHARFFFMGDGVLAIRNAHTGERAEVRYRRSDGAYDAAALATLRRLFRSRGEGAERDPSLRLVEILSMIQGRAGARELRLVSGYRSRAFNEDLRSAGRRAAGGSLHTEALAADVGVAGADLRQVWNDVRALECCGVGLYERDGFIHVDVGRPRFWEPATSRVGENLSAENARVFARTEFDRYAHGEPIELRVHAITLSPIAVARAAALIPERGEGPASSVTVERIGAGARSERAPAHAAAPANGDAAAEGCIDVTPGDRLLVRGAAGTPRARFALRTCEPRPGQTPETIESNLIEFIR